MLRRKSRRPTLENLESRSLMCGVVYSPPIVITQGGTYSGNWESLDPTVPAVKIKTADPVTIVNSNIRGRSDLIATANSHTNLTILNTRGYGLNPNVLGKTAGFFLDADGFDNIDVENNYMEGTNGILLHAGNLGNGTIKIIANSALNIDGRKSDGMGGYLDYADRTNIATGVKEQGYFDAHWLIIGKTRGMAGIEIAWNQVINIPGQSVVEDVINIFNSSGTPDSPIRIHDNYIQGAYNLKPWQTNYSDGTYNYDWGYSGGGILLGDGPNADPTTSTAFVQAYDNQVISTTNYGIAITAGHDESFYNNRIVSSGVLPDGRVIVDQNVGAGIFDGYKTGPTVFFNNSGHDNLVGWVSGKGYNDWWVPGAASWTNNTHMTRPVTPADEMNEFFIWLGKLTASKVVVGPHWNIDRWCGWLPPFMRHMKGVC